MGLEFIYDDGELSLIRARLYQYDNDTRKLSVRGELPGEYSWLMNVKVLGTEYDAISLSADEENGMSAVLSAGTLAYGDEEYEFQLEGVSGEKSVHTNKVKVFIPESFSGNAQWPQIPTVFTELASESSQSALSASDSAVNALASERAAALSAENAALDAAAAQTAAGSMSYVSFSVDESGHLKVKNSELLGSTDFSLNENGHLEVSI